ncbi:hypothetical protein [Aphanothece sacrum]|uniref:Uncharacterized protein n=1 Tax=Aphanothece sacrum FPU1 TaxID=1920663 RepID=A0A401ILM1_APHSA|nr:hypothetical protein [Aphanothece sacrum]GBF82160.1 hypothetical protein AsFPU1_3587 [Aphanothece sacrum FPU1]
MSLTIEIDLKEALDKINQQLEKMDQKFEVKLDTLQKDVNDLKIGQVRLEEKLTGEIKALDAEVKGISKRLDSQEFINRSVVVGFILAIGTGAVKLFFPNFPH